MNAANLDRHPDLFAHPGPWSEAEFMALPGQPWPRLELLDGSLLMTPAPGSTHQHITRRMANLIESALPEDLEVIEGVNVRVGPSRILIPDVVVAAHGGHTVVYDAADVVMVVEVASPSTRDTDRLLKAQFYATAGIDWYLRLDLKGGATLNEVVAYQRDDQTYVEHARAKPGQVLHLDEPIELEFDPAALLRRRG